MPGPDDDARVRQSSRLGQLAVLVLESAGRGETFASAFAAVAADTPQIVVVDCLDLGVLPEATCAEFISAHQQLVGAHRQLIIVNAPEQALPQLRSHGVEVAATTDRTFAGDQTIRVDGDAHALAVELTTAELARDEAFALRDRLERSAEASDQEAGDAVLAARDRAAAALDRYNAALDRKEAAAYLERTYRDDLTGALQRKAGLDQCRREVARANRTGDPLVMAFIDVDRLKIVNDTKGHVQGDRLLAAVGEALRSGLRAYDVVMRYGGDEFVCALPQLSVEDASHRLQDVQQRLAAAQPGATISIGLAQLGEGESFQRVLARADQNLYRVKANAPGR